MKIVPAYGNRDNLHCLQSCVRSTLEYLLPNKRFSKNYIDTKTEFNKESLSWMLPSVDWLDKLGLNVKLYSPFDYSRLVCEGELYLREFKGEDIFDYEKRKGSYLNLDKIRKSADYIITNNLWINRQIKFQEIIQFLKNKNCLIIGKTVHEWLDNNYIKGAQHYVLIIEPGSSDHLIVHDPGKPLKEYREINSSINNHLIFGDALIIQG